MPVKKQLRKDHDMWLKGVENILHWFCVKNQRVTIQRPTEMNLITLNIFWVIAVGFLKDTQVCMQCFEPVTECVILLAEA